MTEVMKGAFETTHSNLSTMLRWTSAPFDERYDQAYVNLSGDGLRTIANAGQAVASYCTFRGDYAQDIALHDSIDEDAGMEAVVNVIDFQEYLAFVGGERVRVEFYGEEDERLAKKMVISGDLTAEIFIPSSKSDIESKQLGVVDLYDERERWVKPSNDEPLSTSFVTTVDEMNKIVDVTNFDDIVLNNVPIVVEDGELVLDAEDENQRNNIEGTLKAEDVQGPDVSNTYSRGVEELFGTISGKVEVMIEQDCPFSVVHSSEDGDFTARYAILPTEST